VSRDLFAIRLDLARIYALLAHIARAINIEGEIMSEVDNRLAQLLTEVGDAAIAITTSASDVDRALADLKAALSGTLTAAQASAFDATDAAVAGLKNSAAAIQAAVDAADPQPAPPVVPEPAPAPAEVPPAG
jgi:hypothetical protein